MKEKYIWTNEHTRARNVGKRFLDSSQKSI